VAGSYEHDNEFSGSMRGGIPEWSLSHAGILKMSSVLWCSLSKVHTLNAVCRICLQHSLCNKYDTYVVINESLENVKCSRNYTSYTADYNLLTVHLLVSENSRVTSEFY